MKWLIVLCAVFFLMATIVVSVALTPSTRTNQLTEVIKQRDAAMENTKEALRAFDGMKRAHDRMLKLFCETEEGKRLTACREDQPPIVKPTMEWRDRNPRIVL